jgi:phenylacetate-CoA ligase
VYPSQVEHTLLGIDGVSPHFQLVVNREGNLDTLHIRVERDGVEDVSDERLESAIVGAMRSSLGIGVTVGIEPVGSLPRSEGGKLARTIDNRSIYGAT